MAGARSAIPELALDLGLEHGRCVGVSLPAAAEGVDLMAERYLATEERAFAATLPALRRRTWVGGRAAMRLALERAGIDPVPPILADARGAPELPGGVAGSISHKDALAVALVARDHGRVGVDVEIDRASATDIASKVLTEEEGAALADLGADERGREVLLRFSLKEAVYKAIDPYVRRYVGFKEVVVVPAPDGGAKVRAPWAEPELRIEARWLRHGGLVLTTARARRSGA